MQKIEKSEEELRGTRTFIEKKFEATKFNVNLYDVKLANEKQFTREIVSHPGSVVILPIMPDGRILLEQYRFGVNEVLLELPAGGVEPTEHPIKTAHRELEEETGYKADKISVFSLLPEFYPSPGISSEKISVFVAEGLDCTNSKHKQSMSENIRIFILTLDEIRSLLAENKLKDAKTILVLSLYLQTI